MAQGVFHNYPQVCPDKINWIVKSLDWLQFYDIITKAVMSQQAWILMPYSIYAVVDWHFHLSTTMHPKLSYPLAMIEVQYFAARITKLIWSKRVQLRFREGARYTFAIVDSTVSYLSLLLVGFVGAITIMGIPPSPSRARKSDLSSGN